MKKILRLASVFALCSAPVFAADEQNVQQKSDFYFSKIDTNGDGSISKVEHKAFADDMFSKADSNRDGSISKDEFLAEKKQEMEEYKMKFGDK